MNLFLPLRIGQAEAFAGFLGESLGRRVAVEDVELEYYGSGDLLAEIPAASPGERDMLTCADVAVHLRDEDGARTLLLIEVKLSESGFSRCNGATSRGNRDRAPCHLAEVFLEEPERCYLRRPYRSRRDRRYWEIFTQTHGSVRAAFPGAGTDACPFVGDWQQPMRNHALCLAAVQAGMADGWALALVHHDDNPDVVPSWEGYTAAVVDRSHLYRWPASQLLPFIDAALADAQPGLGAWLRERYLLEDVP